MKFRKSIRFRIILACVMFSLVVCFTFGYILIKTIKINSDEQFDWHIKKEIKHLISVYNKDKQSFKSTTRGTVVIGNDKDALKQLNIMIQAGVKPDLNPLVKTFEEVHCKRTHHFKKRNYGFYKYRGNKKKIEIRRVKIKGESNLNFYYIIDVTGFNKTDNRGVSLILKHFLVAIIIILVFIFFTGMYLVKKVMYPLTYLATNVDLIEAGQYKSNAMEYYEDEIGYLAKTIDSFVQRTTDFVKRERAFSRDASHELRTPVASSQAALDVAYVLIGDKDSKMKSLLDRVRRANKNMTHLIESFLFLGREKTAKNKDDFFNLRALALSSFEKNSYKQRSIEISCKVEVQEDLMVRAPKQLLSIVLDNLVRNSLEHTDQGTVLIRGDQNSIQVSDSGRGFDSELDAGIGLNIVKRICDQQGWSFEISSNSDIGTNIKIGFAEVKTKAP